MKPIHALVLLVLGLVGCATTDRLAAPEESDPGRLASARQVVNVPGLRPCNDGGEPALHLDPRQKVNVLVHGCNGSTGRFRALAEVLAFHGQQSACFTYDERASLMVSSGRLADAIGALAQGLETPAITVIGHSVGGLIARKALVQERPDAIRAGADRPPAGHRLGAICRHRRGASVCAPRPARGLARNQRLPVLDHQRRQLVRDHLCLVFHQAAGQPCSAGAPPPEGRYRRTRHLPSSRRGRPVRQGRLHLQPRRAALPARRQRPGDHRSRSTPPGTSKSSAKPVSRPAS